MNHHRLTHSTWEEGRGRGEGERGRRGEGGRGEGGERGGGERGGGERGGGERGGGEGAFNHMYYTLFKQTLPSLIEGAHIHAHIQCTQ